MPRTHRPRILNHVAKNARKVGTITTFIHGSAMCESAAKTITKPTSVTGIEDPKDESEHMALSADASGNLNGIFAHRQEWFQQFATS